MLHTVLHYQVAVKKFTADVDNNLRTMELSREEWKAARDLCDVLKVLKDATLYFSRSGTPSLATVIPAMDVIDKVFATAAVNDTKFSAPIRASLLVAKRTLNSYYRLTDESDVYRIAMVLHPVHKLEYFEQAEWEIGWINDARALVREVYDREYKDQYNPGEEEVVHVPAPPTNLFDSLSKAPPPTATSQDELARYLGAPTESTNDAMAWWQENRKLYPSLSRMALDYLSIPATSVDVERAFSRGRLLLPHVRNRLSAQTTRALMCLGDWSRLGFVEDEDVLAVARLPEVPEEEGDEGDVLMPDGWDAISHEES